MFQTTVTQLPIVGRSGDLADTTARNGTSRFVQDPAGVGGLGIMPGRLLMRGAAGDQATLPAGNAADADAYALGASAAAPQVISGALLNGIVGGTRTALGSIVDLVLDNNTDWDATNATLTGITENGEQVSETLAIPDVGNTTVSSTNRYVQVIQLDIPAQTGVNGNWTLGAQASTTLPDSLVLGFAFNDEHREQIANPPLEGGIPYFDGDSVDVRDFGTMWVRTEDTPLEGAPVYVRILDNAAVGQPNTAGLCRSDVAAGAAVQLANARYGTVSAADGVAKVTFDFIG